MRVIGPLFQPMPEIPTAIKDAEKIGFDAVYSAEINNDPFFPLLIAAEHSKKIELMTSIAVAFARNPMTLANLAHDLNQYSQGRFVLGIGSQIKPHITRRLSMPWSKPAARMREFIQAMQAIWNCWYTGEPLNFDGEFYQHTLMTPNFVPPNKDYPAPKVKLAAVGPLMTQVAGEVADGLIAHGFTTAKYLRDVTLPQLEKGLNKSGRSRTDVDITCPVMTVCGDNEEQFKQNRETVRMQIAFYASTPAYKEVLAIHGWEAIQPEATAMSKRGEWQTMGELISDEILNTFAVVAESPNELASELYSRYGDLIDNWECTWITKDNQAMSDVVKTLQNR